MADLDPSHHRVLLVGPRVVGLKPLFEHRRFRVMAASEGVDGMAILDAAPFDLVLLELNLGDLTATEFLMAARQRHPTSTFLLIDDATRAGQIVRAMQAGLDGFLATPPDENRLFFEVDRHLRRVQGTSDDPGGFEEHATQTTMTTMADVEAVPGTPPDSNELERARQTIATLQQDVFRFEGDARRYSEVQQVLGDHLQARLDGDEAMRLRERLGLAQVGEIELMTLRGDVQHLRQIKRDQEARIEEVLRDLKAARAAASATDDLRPTLETSMPTQPLAAAGVVARIAELEAEVAKWEVRARDLETTLQAAKRDLNLAEEDFETAVLEARATARVALDALGVERDVAVRAYADLEQRSVLLASDIARLNGALAQADADRAASEVRLVAEQLETDRLQRRLLGAEQAAADANASSVESEIRRTAANDDAVIAAVDAALVAERARLHGIHQAEVAAERADSERQQAAALEAATAAATAAASDRASAVLRQAITTERDRAHQQQRIAIAEAVAAVESNVGQRMVLLREELQAQVAFAQDAARQARERADDFELQLDEARTRTEFLQEDAARLHQSAEDRIAAAQLAFKKEKLRLVEEKQTASSGSQEAMLKLERYRDEGAVARRAIEELEGQLSLLRAAAAASALIQERAEHELRAFGEEREMDRERTRVAVESLARAEAAMGALQSHARSLEIAEAAARTAEAAAVADAALANARAIASETAVADAAAAVTQLEILVARQGEELEEVKARATVTAADYESQVAQVTRLQHALTLMETAGAKGDAQLSSSTSLVSALQSQLAEVEAAAHEAALATASREQEHDGVRVALMAEIAMLKASMADAAEAVHARLAHEQAAAAAADAAVKGAVADADARVADAAAREAAIMQAAEADLARVRRESQEILSRAMQSVADLEQRAVAAAADRGGLVVEQQRLIAQVLELEAEMATLKASALASPVVGPSAEVSAADTAELNRRINDLESQIARAAPAITATVRSLVDAVDHLRWGLGAAIDYMHPFEGNDPALASHVRNLRLLQATLARLVSESGKGLERG